MRLVGYLKGNNFIHILKANADILQQLAPKRFLSKTVQFLFFQSLIIRRHVVDTVFEKPQKFGMSRVTKFMEGSSL